MTDKVCIQSFNESIAYKVCPHVLPGQCVTLHPEFTYVHSQLFEMILGHFEGYLSPDPPLKAVHHVDYLLILLSEYPQCLFRCVVDLCRDLCLLGLLLFLRVKLGG